MTKFQYRFFDILLATLKVEGLDAKALRAFRVLRPLRFLSGIPSKLIKHKNNFRHKGIKITATTLSSSKFNFRSTNCSECNFDGDDSFVSYCTSCTVCHHNLRNHWIRNVLRASS